MNLNKMKKSYWWSATCLNLQILNWLNCLKKCGKKSQFKLFKTKEKTSLF